MNTPPKGPPRGNPRDPPIVFGPVPSRRLGHSLGINHVPPKTCSYSCVYCQIGATASTLIEPSSHHAPEEVVEIVRRRVHELRERGEPLDALTFVPDGEPTLDAGLGLMIEGLLPLGIRIAVLTNGSLLWRQDVRQALAKAHWVSLKVDAVDEITWRRIQRPDPFLSLMEVLQGMESFARDFEGSLVTETMMVRGFNDTEAHAEEIAEFLRRLEPEIAYLAIPTRPPTERWVRPADTSLLMRTFELFCARLERVELLAAGDEEGFTTTGNAMFDLLSICAVHPLREVRALEILRQDGAEPSLLDALVASGRLQRLAYRGETFYARSFRGCRRDGEP